MSTKVRGWIYVFSNNVMPGLVKIGFTLKDPALRAEELKSTGMPFDFLIEYEALVYDPQSIEIKIHNELSSKREAGEFFRCEIHDAIRVIRSIINTSCIVESINNKLKDKNKSDADTKDCPELSKLHGIDREEREAQIRYLKKIGMWG